MERSYGQLCPAARALDLLGQRWALLIIRNLLVAPMRYGELLHSLSGLTTNLLAQRLKELVEAGLVEHSENQGVPEYAVTAIGERARPVLYALAELGSAFPPGALAKGEVRPAILSLCRTRRPTFEGELELRLDQLRPLYLRAKGGRMESGNLPTREHRVLCKAPSELFLAAIFRGPVDALPLAGDPKQVRQWRKVLAPSLPG